MGDYDATLLGAVAQAGRISVEELRALYCVSDDPDVAHERTVKFSDRLRMLEMLGFITREGSEVTYLGSL